MAIRYWDYQTSGTTGSSYDRAAWTTDASSGLAREILVVCPDCWGEPERAAFTRLVNDDTSTGWKIRCWIIGDVDIIDPTIEKRSLADFVPLLKFSASKSSKSLIDRFFEDVPMRDSE